MKYLSAIFLASALVFSVSCATDPKPADYSQEARQYYNPTDEEYQLVKKANDLAEVGRFAEAREILEKSIRDNANNREALLNLGLLNIMGLDGKQDINKGIAQLEKVAKMGNYEAAEVLGQIYLEGKFVPQDLTKARFWFEKAKSM